MSETAATAAADVTTSNDERLAEALRRLRSPFGREREARGLPPGDRAELRRMDPLGGTLPPAFWRLVVEPTVTAAIDAFARDGRERVERAFAIIVQAMAEAGTSEKAPVGEALARTGYAEERFIRFLRARGRDVAGEARRVAAWCAVKNEPFRFDAPGRQNGFAPFVLHACLDHERAQSGAHAISRDYFRTLARAQSNDTTEKDRADG